MLTDKAISEGVKEVSVTRSCGHIETVQIVDDGRDTTRIARKERKRCQTCAKAFHQPGPAIKKGSELKMLPIDSVVVVRLMAERDWRGSLVADGKTVEAQGSGMLTVISKLARKWLRDSGKQLSGRVVE